MLTEFLRSFTLPGLEKKYIVADDSLTEEGAAADSKKVGEELAKKVDKETGKALSTNDYTNAEKTKLAGVDSGAQVNTIEGVKVDGTEVTPDAQKKVNLNVYDKAAINAIVQAIYAEVAKKLNIDGYSELATVGNALGLVTDSVVEDKEPYNFRSLAHLPVGKFCYDTIVGGSVVWNQLFKRPAAGTFYGVTISAGDDEQTFVLNGTATANVYRPTLTLLKSIKDHVYLITKDKAVDGLWFYNDSKGVGLYSTDLATIGKATGEGIFYVSPRSGSTFDNVKVTFQTHDLTALLTPEVADHIYTLEQANAGAGVAYFRKYFSEEYHEFCEPHFEHVQTSAKETVGFNQWDEETANGYWDKDTGAFVSSNNWKASKNYIPCLPNTAYYFKATVPGSGSFGNLVFYDSDKGHISYQGSTVVNNTFTTPNNCHHMTFYADSRYFANNICINLHGDRDGEYEPYKKRTYPLEALTLRGIPKLDASNRLYFDGDVYQHDGSGETRYKEMTLNGSENWTLFTGIGVNQFYINQSDARNVAGQVCMMCDKYPTVNISDRGNGYGVGYTGAGTICFNIDPTQYADVASWKAYLTAHPITVVYLCTPEPFTAEPFQSPMVVDPLGTEEFVDYAVEQGERDVKIPCGHTSEYPEDLVDKLEVLPHATGTNGDYLITELNGKLYLKPYTQTVGLTSVSETEAE